MNTEQATTDRDRIMRLPEVLSVTSLSQRTIYRLVKKGEFPASVKITSRAVGWRASEVQCWMENRPAA